MIETAGLILLALIGMWVFAALASAVFEMLG